MLMLHNPNGLSRRRDTSRGTGRSRMSRLAVLSVGALLPLAFVGQTQAESVHRGGTVTVSRRLSARNDDAYRGHHGDRDLGRYRAFRRDYGFTPYGRFRNHRFYRGRREMFGDRRFDRFYSQPFAFEYPYGYPSYPWYAWNGGYRFHNWPRYRFYDHHGWIRGHHHGWGGWRHHGDHGRHRH